MKNLGKLLQQQRNQRAIKIKNKTLKQFHAKKLAESFKPTTKKLEEVNESSKTLTEVFEKSDSENETPTQLAIENTPTHPAIANIQHEGVIYDTSLERTITTMKTANNFFKWKKDLLVKYFRNEYLLKT